VDDGSVRPLTCGQDYTYVVRARDSANPPNEEDNLVKHMASLQCPAPPVPNPILDELRVGWNATTRELELDWSAYAALPEVHHYNVYREDGFAVNPDSFGPVPSAPVVASPTSRAWTDPDPTGSTLLFYGTRPANCLDEVPSE